MIYVGAPYTHEDKNVIEQRVSIITDYCAKETLNGNIIFSPIVYGHSLLKDREIPGDYEFWKKFCIYFLNLSLELHVLMIPGWEKSTGLKDEIEIAKELGLEIKYIKI